LALSPNVLVIGNGESRIGCNLNELKDRYVLIGCNAIHRDVRVDHLICCDRRMVLEAEKNIQINETKIYTRSSVPALPYRGELKQDQAEHWGSGGFAVLLGAQISSDITLLGFDLYAKNNQVNNVYKGTQNYSKEDSRPVDHSYWVYQISKVFEYYPDKQFTIVNYPDWNMPLNWQRSNVKFKNIVDL